ncbi:glycosyltransferase family 2 protein [Leptolyngbyaceae cyanobacterium CCMR0082]|uniref:Beta-monoglucosyldiacylglycerol synthase n=2 Tax=Adonisia turfae TaxID=2950184 RepID=A0A6M0S433_9CYAN|nr:glycosyltransferase family 2 protein [Adonisia turfae]MDV3351465.1 glycosyltransferase family 2 protein [Leptothoe sp. LEGE 181152]NEZ59713.1 glycosyltransferase family 2 protein [Adonisia turfae CCMR0081]NEZ63264.1 glycosyltransferase family 2 protein [Adonisia turfae CCMR0082]
MAIETVSDVLLDDLSEGRRLKALAALVFLWSVTVMLHWAMWGAQVVWAVTGLVALYMVRIVSANATYAISPNRAAVPSALAEPDCPPVSLLVAAKNEEAVIAHLVESLCNLDYPEDRYELWVIDDNSDDDTGRILDELTHEYPRLRVLHRGPEATGGKSGALNLAWPRATGEILAVFDADAQVPADLLRRVVPLFANDRTGAIQVRKSIVNSATNFWTQGQAAEMALDRYYQEQRSARCGIGELRGNGQFVRHTTIAQCGGWNEMTITDDLDLTVQLHLHQWNIGFLDMPTVGEEGVTSGVALWHQRNRWAEGGYQRYLDYWRLLVRNRLGWNKSVDMLMYWILQYMLPIVALPDFIVAIALRQPPVFAPLTTLAVGVSYWGMTMGIYRTQNVSLPMAMVRAIKGTLYMTHWVVVMAFATTRMAVRPKRLKWVKTIHAGETASA